MIPLPTIAKCRACDGAPGVRGRLASDAVLRSSKPKPGGKPLVVKALQGKQFVLKVVLLQPSAGKVMERRGPWCVIVRMVWLPRT